MDFVVGQYAEIQTKMRSTRLGKDYDYTTFSGRIVPNLKWVDSDYVCVHTGEPNHPISVIHKRFIVGYQFSQARTNERIFQVKSKSKGKTYMVVSKDGKITCDCTGFSFRRKCSHSDKVRQLLDK
jgi:hypothetical protein